jgi:hypothetical protein
VTGAEKPRIRIRLRSRPRRTFYGNPASKVKWRRAGAGKLPFACAICGESVSEGLFSDKVFSDELPPVCFLCRHNAPNINGLFGRATFADQHLAEIIYRLSKALEATALKGKST